MIKIDNGNLNTEGTLGQLASDAAIILLHIWVAAREQLGEPEADGLLEQVIKIARDQEYREEAMKEYAENEEE